MESISRHFDGRQLLQTDMGVTPEWGRPQTTRKVEDVLADFFGTQACALTQGAGTGAIRAMLAATLSPGDRLVIHDRPPYETSRYTFESMGLDLVRTDFNRRQDVEEAIDRAGLAKTAYIQQARHDPEDSYELAQLTAVFKDAGYRVLTDENYAVFKVHKIGVEVGADASTFSLFKLLGPEGVGCVVGTEELVSRIHSMNYSGGGQVQGHQALDSLRSLVLVPVSWALQAAVVDEVTDRLARGEVEGVASAHIANAQDRMVLAILEKPIAKRVIGVSYRFGAQNYPVGANSRYEIAPWIYRLSGSNLESRPDLADFAIRINPVRAGADLVLSILRKSINAAEQTGAQDSSGSDPS